MIDRSVNFCYFLWRQRLMLWVMSHDTSLIFQLQSLKRPPLSHPLAPQPMKVIKHWNHSRSIDVFPTEELWPHVLLKFVGTAICHEYKTAINVTTSGMCCFDMFWLLVSFRIAPCSFIQFHSHILSCWPHLVRYLWLHHQFSLFISLHWHYRPKINEPPVYILVISISRN